MYKALALGAAVLTVFVGLAMAQDDGWPVPPEESARENPLEASPDALAAGKALYDKHCKMCHGETGKGDGPTTEYIKPAPPDMTTAESRESHTDGDIFYKITTGKRPMPAKKSLSEEERWQLVLYVRELQTS